MVEQHGDQATVALANHTATWINRHGGRAFEFSRLLGRFHAKLDQSYSTFSQAAVHMTLCHCFLAQNKGIGHESRRESIVESDVMLPLEAHHKRSMHEADKSTRS
jgi:hypothetical protein